MPSNTGEMNDKTISPNTVNHLKETKWPTRLINASLLCIKSCFDTKVEKNYPTNAQLLQHPIEKNCFK